MTDIVDRLRGKYSVGPHLPNGNPEFGWRQFQVTPINLEAAEYIESLRARLELADKAHGQNFAELSKLYDAVVRENLELRKLLAGAQAHKERYYALKRQFQMASRFLVRESPHHYTLNIEVLRTGADSWAVMQGGNVLNNEGEFEYQPMPSSRDEDFLARTRFDFKTAMEKAEALPEHLLRVDYAS